MAIQIAESATSKTRKGRQALAHIEIHPQLGGGHIVKHVYHGYDHQAREIHFNEDGKSQGGDQITSHLVKHAGLPKPSTGGTSATEEK